MTMNKTTFLLLFSACLLITHTASAQDSLGIEAAVVGVFPTESTVPVVHFAPPDTEYSLNRLGSFFFGSPLTADSAEEDVGRYLYFSDDNSKLWYYPMSGAFDWIRTNPPIAVEFDTSGDNVKELRDVALSVLMAIRGQASHPMESIEFEKTSKVVAYTGTYGADGKDTERFVRQVDVRFRQAVAGMPVFHGSWAVVSFCGDMEICRVKALLRNVAGVVESDILPIKTVTSMLLSSASELDGPYYVSSVDKSSEPVIGYVTRSESYLQMGAAPILLIPVCQTRVTSQTQDCENQSSIAQPLVGDYEAIEGAFRPKTKHKESADIQIIERPSHCGDYSEGRECAP